jgi:hypothetical protein
MAEFEDYEISDLDWPDEHSMEEVVTALRNYDGKKADIRLTCDFDDETMNTSQELQEAIKNSFDSHPLILMILRIFNSCHNQEKNEQCLDFFLRQLELGTAFTASYYDLNPWTLVEAQKAAAIITRSNNGSTELTLSGDLFAVEGTFECVFNAVIDGGTINEFVGQAESFPDLKLGCIGRSNLANNTTLKRFSLELWKNDMFVADEGIEQLANALKSNQGLEEITITRGVMTNAGRIHLLESLRDNTTLLKLDTKALPVISSEDDVNEDEVLLKEGGIEGRLLQSHFDRHMKLNRFWKRLRKRDTIVDKNNDGDRNDDDDDDNDDNVEKYLGRRSISMEILPDILEILAKKSLLLYTFIREEDHTQLFGTLYDRPLHSTRRRSGRLFKKRRIAAPGGKY